MSPADEMSFETWEKWFISIFPKIPAILSIIGSCCIIQEVVGDHREKHIRDCTQRGLFVMSVFDLCSSFAFVLTTWPMPNDTPGAVMAFGNTSICSAVGGLYQFGLLGAALTNSSLSLYYLLMIKYNTSAAKLKRVEIWTHTLVFSVSLGTAIAGFPLTLYNGSLPICHISPYPFDCEQSWEGDHPNCARGDNATVYLMLFALIPLWASILFASIAMVAIYRYVRQLETRNTKYDYSVTNSTSVKISQSRSVPLSPLAQAPSGRSIIIRNQLEGRMDRTENRDIQGSRDSDALARPRDLTLEQVRCTSERILVCGSKESQDHGVPPLQQQVSLDTDNLNKNLQDLESRNMPSSHKAETQITGMTDDDRNLGSKKNLIAALPDSSYEMNTRGETLSQKLSRPILRKCQSSKRLREREVSQRMKQTTRVASQARWYLGAFILTYFPVTLYNLIWEYIDRHVGDPIGIIAYFFLPLQGFFNFMVFMQQRNRMHGALGRRLRDFLMQTAVSTKSCMKSIVQKCNVCFYLKDYSTKNNVGQNDGNRDRHCGSEDRPFEQGEGSENMESVDLVSIDSSSQKNIARNKA